MSMHQLFLIYHLYFETVNICCLRFDLFWPLKAHWMWAKPNEILGVGAPSIFRNAATGLYEAQFWAIPQRKVLSLFFYAVFLILLPSIAAICLLEQTYGTHLFLISSQTTICSSKLYRETTILWHLSVFMFFVFSPPVSRYCGILKILKDTNSSITIKQI